MMCHRQNDSRRLGRNEYHVIGKALNSNAFYAAFAKATWPGRPGDQALTKRIERSFECLAKLDAEARPLVLIPSGCSFRLKRRGLEEVNGGH